MASEKSFWRFLSSFTPDWLGLMSGGLSVPLTVLAIIVPGTAYKIGLTVLAFIALVLAAYRGWMRERQRALSAEAAQASLQAALEAAEMEAAESQGTSTSPRYKKKPLAAEILKEVQG